MTAVECTGVAASWCPAHGDCTCPRDGDGEIVWHYEADFVGVHGVRAWSETARSVVDHDPECPLHAPGSAHGEPDGR